jgi:recombination protein RecT
MQNEMKEAAKTSLQKQEPQKLGTIAVLKNLLNTDQYKKRFDEIIGQRAPQFMASIINLVSSNTNFNGVDPNTVISSALIAATLDLPINPQLGYAHIIPYAGKATFQLGWRAYKQLAIRTSLYAFINSTDVREGELRSRNRLSGQVVIEFIEEVEERENKKVIGYVNYFKLLTGYESTLYMSMEELFAHAKKYSKLYQNDLRKNKKESKWSIESELPFMCLKTVTKLNLSNNGILSVEMQKAKTSDEAILDNDLEPVSYPEGGGNEIQTNFEKELSPEDWENPTKIIEKIESFTDVYEFQEFLEYNERKLDAIGGKDKDLIDAVIKSQDEKLKTAGETERK